MENENKPKEVIRNYTETDIQNHAAKVGGIRNLREVSILVDNGEYQFDYLIKKPTRAILEAITDKKENKDYTGVAKLLIGCVLEGDKEAYENDGALYEQLLQNISELATSAEGYLKKL